jgi:hypothetical protein
LTDESFFERPILNSPYERPARHWELGPDGQPTGQIVETGREARFITPIPRPKKQKRVKGQERLVFDEGAGVSTAAQQYDPTPVINELRRHVDQWRAIANPGSWGVTPETARLLQHWRHHEFSGVRPFFCQIEAAETAIWLTEAALGNEIADLSAHLEAATARLLDLIREFDAREGWNSGFRSCAHWLSWRVGLDLGAARQRVRVARALGTLPRLAEALAHGELSYAKVRALTRIATPETEERLLKFGRTGTADHVERLVRGWRRVDRIAEACETAERHKRRALHVYQDEDGGRRASPGRANPDAELARGAVERGLRDQRHASAGEVTMARRPKPQAGKRVEALRHAHLLSGAKTPYDFVVVDVRGRSGTLRIN